MRISKHQILIGASSTGKSQTLAEWESQHPELTYMHLDSRDRESILAAIANPPASVLVIDEVDTWLLQNLPDLAVLKQCLQTPYPARIWIAGQAPQVGDWFVRNCPEGNYEISASTK